MCMSVLHEFMCITCRQVPQRLEGMELPGARVKGSCEPPDDAGNWTWDLCESIKHI